MREGELYDSFSLFFTGTVYDDEVQRFTTQFLGTIDPLTR